MASIIVDLDEVVPDDLVFTLKGHKYVFPGDLKVEDTLRLQKLYFELLDDEVAVLKAVSQGPRRQQQASAKHERTILAIKAHLLACFREREPEVEDVPGGVAGYQTVLLTVLRKLGVILDANAEQQVGAEEGGANPPQAKPKRQSPKKRSSARRRSPGSSK